MQELPQDRAVACDKLATITQMPYFHAYPSALLASSYIAAVRLRLFRIWDLGLRIRAATEIRNHQSAIYNPNNTDPSVKNVPATQAVIRQARVAATKDRTATLATSLVRLGARAHTPPTKMAMEARCVNPHKA